MIVQKTKVEAGIRTRKRTYFFERVICVREEGGDDSFLVVDGRESSAKPSSSHRFSTTEEKD